MTTLALHDPEAIDGRRTGQCASQRGIPAGHDLGDFWREYRGARVDILREWDGALRRIYTVERCPEIRPSDVARLWDRAIRPSDLLGVSTPYPRPYTYDRVWQDAYIEADRTLQIPFGATDHIEIPARKGQKVSRAILRGLRKSEHATPEAMGVWERFFEGMGALWSGAEPEQWTVCVDIAPSSFLNLGHYGEGGSCYRCGGQYSFAPWVLALLPRSVVFLFYRGAHTDPRGEPAGRAWGQIGDADHPGAIVSNLYGLPWDTVRPLIRSALASHFGGDPADYETEAADSDTPAPGCSYDAVYLNGDAQTVARDPLRFEGWISTETNYGADEWARPMDLCERCEDPLDEYDRAHCDNCGVHLCLECATYFEDDGWYCRRCRTPAGCWDCGATFDADDTIECEDCGSACCPDCAHRCEGCDAGRCGACVESCKGCGAHHCPDCLTACQGCEAAVFCPDCRPDCEGCAAPVCGGCAPDHRADVCPQLSFGAVA